MALKALQRWASSKCAALPSVFKQPAELAATLNKPQLGHPVTLTSYHEQSVIQCRTGSLTSHYRHQFAECWQPIVTCSVILLRQCVFCQSPREAFTRAVT